MSIREPSKRTRPWYAADTRRQSPSERGYDSKWCAASEVYRRQNPLCVPCLLAGRVRPSQCVDHIVPARSCRDLFWMVENWCAMCNPCHARKTTKEPRNVWLPDYQRVVVCGLPGTGKTTWAKDRGAPYWDADEHPTLTSIDSIVEARSEWTARHDGPCTVIVASPVTASSVAALIRGMVHHMTEVWPRVQ